MIDRNTFFTMLLELLEFEEEDEKKCITEETSLEEVQFDSVTKLGVLALLDTYVGKSIKVKDISNCEKVGDIIDLVDFK